MRWRTHRRTTRSRAGVRGAGLALIVAALTAVASAALAAPPHGEGGHPHHVATGNGGCVTVDAVAFRAEDRGLHQGANKSGPEAGPWHGPCS
jgi:hypothetical protein